MIVLCQGFCYIKDISIYIVIQIISTLAEKHGSPQGFSPLSEFRPPDSKPQGVSAFEI